MRHYIGLMIKKKRLERNYSQEGLCKGICAVSYLSKIENDCVEASEDILHALLDRLSIKDLQDPIVEEAQQKLHEFFCYRDLMNKDYRNEVLCYVQKREKLLLASTCFIEVLLIKAIFYDEEREAALQQLLPYQELLHQEQKEYYILAKCLLTRTISKYLEEVGQSLYVLMQMIYLFQESYQFERALHLCERVYEKACIYGYVHTMLSTRLAMGNCYAHTLQMDLLLKTYEGAITIATALKDEKTISSIYYNIGACYLQLHDRERAYAYLKKTKERSILYYHKMAMYYEEENQKEQALEMLELGYQCPKHCYINTNILDVIAYRLEHEAYLKDKIYQDMMLALFQEFQRIKAYGFILSHLPYVIEILKERRQYKECVELLQEFSLYDQKKIFK